MTNDTGSRDFGLGRVPEFDERSREFPVRALLAAELAPRSYTWRCEATLDQGQEGTCVGFAWSHEITARPSKWPVNNFLGRLIYREATQIDPWPENDAPDYNFGTSVLAGVKTAQQLGWYSEYRWAFSLNDLILAIGYKGPAVLGIPWYESMFDPDAKGVLEVTGSPVGGHAIVANGVSIPRRLVRLHNSWSANWGINGEAFISFENLDKLLHEGGEACIPVLRHR